MDVVSPARYLSLYLRLTGTLLAAAMAFNAIVDPLWVYHQPWFAQRFVKDQRQGNPGLARFLKYDAVVVGNSLSENFLVSEIQQQLGWNAIKLCIAGSTPREQRLILDQAIQTGQVRHVLWSIDMFSFEYGPDATRFADFPYHLYQRDLSTVAKYLLSASTLTESVKVVFGGGPADLEARHVWHHKSTFGPDQVFARWRSDVEHRRTKPNHDDLAWEAAQRQVCDAIRKHPEIQFHFVMPPYSALYRVSELIAPGNQFTSRMRFKRRLAQELLTFSNVEVFDFETIHEVTHDLQRYMDLVHFDLGASSAMLAWMAEGRYRLTPETVDQQIQELEQDTHSYAQMIFTEDNSIRDRLDLKELGLSLPEQLVSAVPTKQDLIRTAAEASPTKR